MHPLYSCKVNFEKLKKSHVVVVRAVGGLLHGCVFLIVSDLHTHHRVHVEADQLPGLDHCDADLMGDTDPLDLTESKNKLTFLQL